MWTKRHDLFCTPYWFILDYTFQAWPLSLLAILFSRTVLGYSGYICISTIWQTPWDIAPGSFLVANTTGYSPSAHTLLGWDQFLQQCRCTTLLIVWCHSEWHVEHLSFYISLIWFSYLSISSSASIVSVATESSSWQFPLPDVVLCYLYHLVEPDKILCVRFI